MGHLVPLSSALARARLRPLALALSLAAILTPGLSLGMDWVVLRSGEHITGTVLRATQDEVSIKLDSGGVLSFRAGRVARVHRVKTGRYGGYGGFEEIVYDGSSTSVTPQPKAEEGPKESAAAPPEPAPRPKEHAALALFPLHAQRTGSAPPDDPEEPPAEPVPHRDLRYGFSIQAPSGFRPWRDPSLQFAIQGFLDPKTQASITVSLQPSVEPLDRLKDGVVQRTRGRVLRQNRARVRSGESAWVLESELQSGVGSARQLQLLVKRDDQVFSVSCMVEASRYPGLAPAFEECLASFRIEEREVPEEPEEQSAALPGHVEQHLRSVQNRRPGAAPPSSLDPNAFRVPAGPAIEKVDERMRQGPLQPYTIKP